MDKYFCRVCGIDISGNGQSAKGLCLKCYSHEYQRKRRAENPKAVNKAQNEYYHKNKERMREYHKNYTRKNNKTFVYFAIYPDGLYIGSTFWGIQRKSYHMNNLNDNYKEYVLNHVASSFHYYELPNKTPNKYLRLLEAFLINKIDPQINMSKMKNKFYFEFSDIPFIYEADRQSDEIIEWAKTIPEISRFL